MEGLELEITFKRNILILNERFFYKNHSITNKLGRYFREKQNMQYQYHIKLNFKK